MTWKCSQKDGAGSTKSSPAAITACIVARARAAEPRTPRTRRDACRGGVRPAFECSTSSHSSRCDRLPSSSYLVPRPTACADCRARERGWSLRRRQNSRAPRDLFVRQIVIDPQDQVARCFSGSLATARGRRAARSSRSIAASAGSPPPATLSTFSAAPLRCLQRQRFKQNVDRDPVQQVENRACPRIGRGTGRRERKSVLRRSPAPRDFSRSGNRGYIRSSDAGPPGVNAVRSPPFARVQILVSGSFPGAPVFGPASLLLPLTVRARQVITTARPYVDFRFFFAYSARMFQLTSASARFSTT